MTAQTTYPLSLNGDTFNSLKSDFDQMLRKLLSGMEKFECEEATLNIKVAVKLEKDQARDLEALESEAMRDIVKPTFKHEISSAMQVKDKKSGSVGGNYELVWDRESGQYIMRNIEDGQTSLFDEDINGSTGEQLALPANHIIEADFEPPGEVYDVEYEEVEPTETDESNGDQELSGPPEDEMGDAAADYPYEEPGEELGEE